MKIMSNHSKNLTFWKKMQKYFKENGIVILISITIALLFRIFLFDPFYVPSGSMIPTLLPGDRMFVSKYSYGYGKYSFPFKVFPIKDRIFKSLPKRGDVAVFIAPFDKKTFYVKRIIGLPGDKIEISNNVISINGKEVKSHFKKNISVSDYEKMGGEATDWNGKGDLVLKKETTEANVVYKILTNLNANKNHSGVKVFNVPKDHFFAMGDNRDNSFDSRFKEVGFIPVKNLIGKPNIIFFSSDKSILHSIFQPKSIRFSRIFQKIQPEETKKKEKA